jgi:hypothetical protein
MSLLAPLIAARASSVQPVGLQQVDFLVLVWEFLAWALVSDLKVSLCRYFRNPHVAILVASQLHRLTFDALVTSLLTLLWRAEDDLRLDLIEKIQLNAPLWQTVYYPADYHLFKLLILFVRNLYQSIVLVTTTKVSILNFGILWPSSV